MILASSSALIFIFFINNVTNFVLVEIFLYFCKILESYGK